MEERREYNVRVGISLSILCTKLFCSEQVPTLKSLVIMGMGMGRVDLKTICLDLMH